MSSVLISVIFVFLISFFIYILIKRSIKKVGAFAQPCGLEIPDDDLPSIDDTIAKLSEDLQNDHGIIFQNETEVVQNCGIVSDAVSKIETEGLFTDSYPDLSYEEILNWFQMNNPSQNEISAVPESAPMCLKNNRFMGKIICKTKVRNAIYKQALQALCEGDETCIEKMCELGNLVVLKNGGDTTLELPESCKGVVGMKLTQPLPVLSCEGEKLFSKSSPNYLFNRFHTIHSILVDKEISWIINDPLFYICSFVAETNNSKIRKINGDVLFMKCCRTSLGRLRNTSETEFDFLGTVDLFNITPYFEREGINQETFVNKTKQVIKVIFKDLCNLLSNSIFVDYASFIGQISRSSDAAKRRGMSSRLKTILTKLGFNISPLQVVEPDPHGNEEDSIDRISPSAIDEQDRSDPAMFANIDPLSRLSQKVEENLVYEDKFRAEENARLLEILDDVEDDDVDYASGEYFSVYSGQFSTKGCDNEGKDVFNFVKTNIRSWYSKKFKQFLTFYNVDVDGNISTSPSGSNHDTADIYPSIKVEMMIIYLCLYFLVDSPKPRFDLYIATYVLYVQLFNSFCACNMQAGWNRSIGSEYVYYSHNINGRKPDTNLLSMFSDVHYIQHFVREKIDSFDENIFTLPNKFREHCAERVEIFESSMNQIYEIIYDFLSERGETLEPNPQTFLQSYFQAKCNIFINIPGINRLTNELRSLYDKLANMIQRFLKLNEEAHQSPHNTLDYNAGEDPPSDMPVKDVEGVFYVKESSGNYYYPCIFDYSEDPKDIYCYNIRYKRGNKNSAIKLLLEPVVTVIYQDLKGLEDFFLDFQRIFSNKYYGMDNSFVKIYAAFNLYRKQYGNSGRELYLHLFNKSITSIKQFTFKYYNDINKAVITGTTIPERPCGNVNLYSINIPRMITANRIMYSVEGIGMESFQNIKYYEKITIPNNIVYIEARAFLQCEELKEIEFETPTALTLGDECFRGCVSLVKINLPSCLKILPPLCFFSCPVLTNIIIPASVNTLGRSCFMYCRSLQKISIPAGVIRIESSCFKFCLTLVSVVFEKNSQLHSIGMECFLACAKLDSIILPSRSVFIDEDAFEITCSIFYNEDFEETEA